MRIIWKQWDTPPSIRTFGHGVHFHNRQQPDESSLVAWVDGYTWFHGKPEEVLIWSVAPDSINANANILEMKEIIGSYIERSELPHGKIGENLYACPNG